MAQISYVDGQYLAHGLANTHIEDRGYQFADAVYEGIGYIAGIALDADGHYARLEESLQKVDIPLPIPMSALKVIVDRVVRANRLRTGFMYLQISRGVAPRDHVVVDTRMRPVVVVTAKHMTVSGIRKVFEQGISVDFAPDIRWQRCDIKTTGLLGNCMAKMAVRTRGFDDAWLLDEQGMVTEGSASNAWIVDAEGCLRTRALSAHILRGITRTELLKLLDGLPFREEAFSREEASNAKEAFISSASLAVRAVVKIGNRLVGDGKPGSVTKKLQYAHLVRNDPSLPALFGLVKA